MPAVASDAASASPLNCGLWRERGTVRTSTSCVTRWATSIGTNSSIGRVEWPTVSTWQAGLAAALAPPVEPGGLALAGAPRGRGMADRCLAAKERLQPPLWARFPGFFLRVDLPR